MKKKELATIQIPLSGVKCLYRSTGGRKVVCEIDLAHFRAVNEDLSLEEMFAEAELEYAAGLTEGFTDSKKLLASLRG
ncbi:MAG: hypothetical protein NUV84_01005 [Candidatus Uhrbacteria bacterium]|nr:hypothetical protein [Candidatus Uhrbacteria bacterium]